ncbi:MAG TPA: cupin domain-containing protein [Solirubrobacteraceae bacterium]|nr:cupin domain-containing protein [Solirubrobacteraceae bacterium]
MVSRFVSFGEVPSFALAAGAGARALFGERAMLNLVEMEPGATVPVHAHPHEQLGLILRGSMTMTIADEQREMRHLDAYLAPPGVDHGGTAGPEGALILDVFAPVREDYRHAAEDAAG